MTQAPSRPPSRVPPWKRLWSDFGVDPKLRAVGPAGFGAYATILACSDLRGVFRAEGTTPAVQILADRLGVERPVAEELVEALRREGLVSVANEGIALPREAFLRRQPELDEARVAAAPVAPPAGPADVGERIDPRPRPAARASAPLRVVRADEAVETALPPRPRGGRPKSPQPAMSSTERSDRRRFRLGTLAGGPTRAGQTFEAWCEESEAGRRFVSARRETIPGYLGRCNGNCNGNCNANSPEVFVAAPPPSHTLPSSQENQLLESNPSNCNGNCNANLPAGCNAILPWGVSVATDEAKPSPDDEPQPPPRALPAPDTRREITRTNGAVVRAFLDAVNAPGAMPDGRVRGREVVVEMGQWVKPSHVLDLGGALLDANVLPGTSLFDDLVTTLRDPVAFARIYARRKCAAVGKITASELVHQDAFALKQALNDVLARRPGATLFLAPSTQSDRTRQKQPGGLRPRQFIPSGTAHAPAATWSRF